MTKHRLVQIAGGVVRHFIDDVLRAEFSTENEAQYRSSHAGELPPTEGATPAPAAAKKSRKAK